MKNFDSMIEIDFKNVSFEKVSKIIFMSFYFTKKQQFLATQNLKNPLCFQMLKHIKKCYHLEKFCILHHDLVIFGDWAPQAY